MPWEATSSAAKRASPHVEPSVERLIASRVVAIDRQRRDEPDAVRRVVGDDRVAGPGVQAGWLARDREPREQAVRPRPTVVLRDRIADIRCGAVEPAADLEGRYCRAPEREAVGLDLGFVLGLRVGVRVAGESTTDELAVAGDRVEEIGGDNIRPGAATRRVASSVVLDRDSIVPGAGVYRVTTCGSDDEICAREAGDPIVAGTTEEVVRAWRADESIVPGRPDDRPRAGDCGAEQEAGQHQDEHAHSRGTTTADSPSLHRGDYDPVS